MVSSCIGLVLKAQTPMAAFFEQKTPVLTRQPLWLGDTTRIILRLVVVKDKLCIIPCSSKVCLPTARSRGSIRTSIEIQPSLSSLSCSDPIKAFSTTWIQLMWSPTPMTRSKQSLLVTTRSVRSLPCSTPWLIPRSRYLRRLRDMEISGTNPLIPWISPMSRIFERSSVYKNVWSFHLLSSMGRTWLISREIAKWFKCIQRWFVPPIWRLPTGATICSPR